MAWLVALLVARWLQPTEGNIEGLTVWMLPLVFLTALVRSLLAWRFDDARRRFDVADLAIASLAGISFVSALPVIWGVGDGRVAWNITWEWIGSAVLVGMLRRELSSIRVIREVCFGLSLTAVVLAGYGLWQHYFWYDQMAVEFNEMVTKHDDFEKRLADPNSLRVISAEELREHQTLKATMRRQGIPWEPESRRMYEDRLKRSREPFGLFALANSFAGLLGCLLLIMLGLEHSHWFHRGAAWLGIGITGWCLLLTKSRTAWVGLVAGLLWWGWRSLRNRDRVPSSTTDGTPPLTSRNISASTRRALLIAGGLLVAGVMTITATGGLDKYVVSEAFKSLRYRGEYWRGTWAVILDHFWLGTGPGQFREYYLQHKLPESSEEILDPHNLWFDVWANSGVLAAMALLFNVVLMVRDATRKNIAAPTPSNVNSTGGELRTVAWGAGLAFPLVAVGLELFGAGWDPRMLSLGAAWWIVAMAFQFVGRRQSPRVSLPESRNARLPICLESAIVLLLTHLLGAGGIAMPAITQLLWLLWAMRRGDVPSTDQRRTEWECPHPILAGVSAVGLGLCVWTVTWPDLMSRPAMILGDSMLAEGRDPRMARSYYEAAEAADPWAVEPLERQAEVAWQSCQLTGQDSDFEAAVTAQRRFIQRLPFANRGYRRLGQMAQAWFARKHRRDDGILAAESFQAAVERYPHRADLLAEWAESLSAIGRTIAAREAAQRALDQEAINRRARHSDKYLTDSVRHQMERLVNTATRDSPTSEEPAPSK